MQIKRIVILILVAALLVLGLLVMLPGLFASPRTAAPETPSGSIVISSVTDATLPFLDTYVLDVGTHTLVMDEPDSVSQENMYAFSSNGSAVTFLGTTQALVQGMISQHTQGDSMQVYRASFDPTMGALPSVSQAQELTNDVTDQKSVPVISDDSSSVLYMQIPVRQIATSSPSIAGYTIHLLSDASTTLSVPGMYPQWYGQGLFYYLGSDGVRLYDIANATSTLVLPIQAQSNFKLAISHDGSMLAFSVPDSNSVFVYSIGANGRLLTPLKTIDTSGYWMVFSPDDAFLAVQTTDSSGTPEIQIFDTKNFSEAGAPISLSPLINSRLFVTAWLP